MRASGAASRASCGPRRTTGAGTEFSPRKRGQTRLMAYGLLLIRVVVGAQMAAHGAQKMFGWFGGGGPRGTAGFFGNLRFRQPPAMARVAAAGGPRGGLL